MLTLRAGYYCLLLLLRRRLMRYISYEADYLLFRYYALRVML